jgi:hypothetical protein
MLAAVLMIAQAASAMPALERYRERTRADVPCRVSDDPAEISVCGRREADRYRVTFIEPAESDRDRPLEYTDRLLDGRTKACGVNAFTDCGMVGVSAKMGFDGKVTRERPLAP